MALSTHLGSKQKAAIADCSCPLPARLHHAKLSKKAIIMPFVIFAIGLYVVWALWPTGALWILAIYAVLIVSNIVYRVFRGHTARCALQWSPVAALYAIGEGIAGINV